jgi:hypothetical protein
VLFIGHLSVHSGELMPISNTYACIRYLKSALQWGWPLITLLLRAYEKQDDEQQDLEVAEDHQQQICLGQL